jgi:hypothetical protein
MDQERLLKNKGPHKPEVTKPAEKTSDGGKVSPLASLQQTVGNRAVQRLIAQRQGDGAFALDDETANRISSARGGGKALDPGMQESMGQATGHDFGGVRVHTSPEADTLSKQLHARAFTTGQDIFFREGTYNPTSSAGKKLIAHELTHVVQQSGGGTGKSLGRMTVHGPNDAFEQEANAVADRAVQRQEEEEVQAQAEPEEEEEIQAQEEEEEVQAQEEEEEVQAQEEEEVQAQEEEEEVQAQEEEEVQAQEEEEVQAQDELEEEI